MRLTLIRPNLFARRAGDAMEPLGLAVLGGLTPRRVERVLYDDRIEPVPYDEPTDLVALTVETYTARRAYEIAAHYRRRGVPVVMGGHHPTLLPDEALEHADAIVVGDAEGVWEELLEDAERRRLRRLYRRAEPPPLGGHQVDRSLYRGKRYAPLALVQFGRGCRYACDFCSIRAFYGTRVRQRPVPEVLAEIESLDARHVFFVDDNLFANPDEARELVAGLVPLGVEWSCQCSIDVARDPALVRLMARSGCVLVLVGFESLQRENLEQMRKGWNLKHGSFTTVISRLRDAGIMIHGTFVFGYDGDTPDSFDHTLEFALDHKLCLAHFNPLTPIPGTPLLTRLQAEKRLIFHRWWLDPDYRYGEATFHPRGMSADELTNGCYRARTKFNTMRSIVGRLVGPGGNHDGLRHAGLFLLANLVSRREIHAKQGRRLGGP